MEILNNIWIALSTENASLINLLSIPMLFIENFIIMTIFINIFKINSSLKFKLLYVLLSSIIGFITIKFIPEPFNYFVNYSFMFIFILLLFKTGIIKSAISVVIPILLFGLIGNLTLKPYLSIFNIEYNAILNIPIYRATYLLVTYGIAFIISLILKYKHITINLMNELNRKEKILIVLNILLGFFTMAVQIIINSYYLDLLPIYITFLTFLLLIAYFVLSIYSLIHSMKLTQTKRELENAEAYNKTLTILHDNVRGFKHDFDNIVATIGGFVNTDDMDGLKAYYKELEDDCQRVNNLSTLNPKIINNPGVYSLLTSKYNKADKLNIKINLEVFLDLNSINMKIYEFTRILGILLDNAIEASSECEEKIINIKFRNDNKNSRQLIIIENTYLNKEINTEEIYLKGFSGKENHSGLGLWEVRKIINKLGNANLFTTKTEKYFKQQLEIYKK